MMVIRSSNNKNRQKENKDTSDNNHSNDKKKTSKKESLILILAERTKMKAELSKKLSQEFLLEIEKLEEFLQRDLSCWKNR